MRLHRLEMTAFGPFAQTVVVEFDALAADGLFVLSGDTGAGKTTVLDAVAFALYGTVPGQRRECRRLHSDHAPADVAPRVMLEATLGGRRIRLSRSPEHVRPKRRGDGVRTEPARATLIWLDGGGVNLTRITEIADEVNRLLGMSADQFFQVVLLPQGDFARFLSATNDDREILLERLFDTQRFADAESWLAARRRESEAALAGHRHAIERLVAQICTAAAVPDPGEYSVDWAQSVLESARSANATVAVTLSRRRMCAAEAEQAYREGSRIAAAQLRIRTARAVLDELAATESQRIAAAAELAAARRAQDVGAAYAELRRAEECARSAEAAMYASRDRVTELAGAAVFAGLTWPPDGTDAEVIDSEIRGWAEESGRLRGAVADADTVRQLADELDVHAEEHSALLAGQAVVLAELADLPQQSRDVRERLRDMEITAAAVDSLTETHARAQAALDAAREFADCAVALDRAREGAAQRREEHVEARERVVDLRERRLAGMAAELAAGLTDGSPCAVCGATSHPAPATAATVPVNAADEQAAAAAELRAGVARERVDAAVAVLERQRGALAARGGADDPVVLRASADASSAALATARAAQMQVAALRAEAARIDGLADELNSSAADLAARITTVAARIAAVEARMAELRSRIPADDPEARIAHLNALTLGATRLRDSRASVHNAAVDVSGSTRRLQESADAAGFPAIADALAAVRATPRLTAIEEQLAASATRRAGAEAVLADALSAPQVVDTVVDIAALQRNRDAASAALDDAIGASATAAERVRLLEDLTVQVWSAFDRIEPAERHYAELARIAEIVAGRGENIRRISLRSYVLAARLEEVVIAASQRLRRMSAGRYEFVHTDATGPRGRRGGLGLEIRDDYTGSVRPTRTLSGGETFTASLSLALGLADVVAAESGGLVLDTMFIDEGFGSLDNETLDSVMGVLDELRAGGRVVGIVSHVDEIRQRIPNRLHVIRDRSGSRLELLASG